MDNNSFVKLFQTRKDKSHRKYYACKCSVCGEVKEVRNDRMDRIKHSCTPKEKPTIKKPAKAVQTSTVTREIKYRNRNIVNARLRVMTVKAANKAEMEKTIQSLKEIYIILN